MAFSSEVTEAVPAWRDRALRRSLDPAAARSMARLERLLDAARELTDEADDASFTVAEVAGRAGVSLKTFYRSFASKDDLLLALLEEESRTGAAMLQGTLERESAPAARYRAFRRLTSRDARHGVYSVHAFPRADTVAAQATTVTAEEVPS